MFVMRFTIIDPQGSVSFVAPCNALKALAAACSKAPTNLEELLSASVHYDNELRDYVTNSLAIFDEHHDADRGNGSPEHIRAAIDYAEEQRTQHQIPAFRVVDEITREASLQPVQAGLVVFNLKDRRIVQVQNTYADVKRQDRGRIHVGGEPTDKLYQYKLPLDWRIVP